jgi:transcriptional regulator with XRE-family HTH domain
MTVEDSGLTERRAPTTAAAAVAATIARQVRALRQARGWSLEELAQRSGVSKGMVVQIEGDRTNPSIGTLCRIAEAFGVDMGRLIETGPQPPVRVLDAAAAPVLWHGPAGGVALLMAGVGGPAPVEVWQWRIEPGERRVSEEHSAGTRELILVQTGALIVDVDEIDYQVGAGALIEFHADRPHGYRNDAATTATATMTVVMPPGERDRRATLPDLGRPSQS